MAAQEFTWFPELPLELRASNFARELDFTMKTKAVRGGDLNRPNVDGKIVYDMRSSTAPPAVLFASREAQEEGNV